jgi:hypothetical protein
MRDWLQVEGVPMCPLLVSQFIERNVVTNDGELLEAERYIRVFNHVVCPSNAYHFLLEIINENISIYQIILRFIISQTPARRLLSPEFYQAAVRLQPDIVLESLVGIRSQLLIGWPTVVMADAFHATYRGIRRNFNLIFPNHSLRELSRVLRLSSWKMPDIETIP